VEIRVLQKKKNEKRKKREAETELFIRAVKGRQGRERDASFGFFVRCIVTQGLTRDEARVSG
jgi:hypothetical protein